MRTQHRKVGPACRAGLSSKARTALERTSAERQPAALQSTFFARRSQQVAKSIPAEWTYRLRTLST